MRRELLIERLVVDIDHFIKLLFVLLGLYIFIKIVFILFISQVKLVSACPFERRLVSAGRVVEFRGCFTPASS
jgi:hypothetical protein